MSLRAILDVLSRRWQAAAAAMLCVIAVVVFAVRATPPTYSYSSAVLLLPPEVSRAVTSSQPDFTQGNPLFYLGTLGQATDILIASLSSKQTSDLVLAKFPHVTYEAAEDVLSSGPIVVITSESSSKAEADGALSMLTSQAAQNLGSLQSDLDIEPRALISSHVLTRDKTPDVSYTDSIRAGVVVGGGLMLALFFLLGMLDSLLLRRRQRSDDDQVQESVEPPLRLQTFGDGQDTAARNTRTVPVRPGAASGAGVTRAWKPKIE